MPSFDYEYEKQKEGYTAVCGCDEAGRGPLCGPVVAAAVILPLGVEIEGLNDSKKLTEKKREKLFDIIKEKALAYAIAEASPAEIDEINTSSENSAKEIAEKKIADGNADALTGIPMAIKDNICTKDIKTTCSSKMLAEYAPPYRVRLVPPSASAHPPGTSGRA